MYTHTYTKPTINTITFRTSQVHRRQCIRHPLSRPWIRYVLKYLYISFISPLPHNNSQKGSVYIYMHHHAPHSLQTPCIDTKGCCPRNTVLKEAPPLFFFFGGGGVVCVHSSAANVVMGWGAVIRSIKQSEGGRSKAPRRFTKHALAEPPGVVTGDGGGGSSVSRPYMRKEWEEDATSIASGYVSVCGCVCGG